MTRPHVPKRLFAVEMLKASRNPNALNTVVPRRILVIDERVREINTHAAERVNQFAEAIEVHDRVIVDSHTEVILNGSLRQAGPRGPATAVILAKVAVDVGGVDPVLGVGIAIGDVL